MILSAVLLTTVLRNTSAGISESVVGRIVRRGTGAWSWLDTAGLDLDVAHRELRPVARTRATVVPQPRCRTAPIRNHEAHALGDVVAHIVQVRAVTLHGLGLAILSEGCCEAGELVVFGVELKLDMERLESVDGVVGAGAVVSPS